MIAKTSLLAALLASALLSANAAAQVLSGEIIGAKSALTAEQRKAVAADVDARAARFAEADPAEVVSMRTEMINLLKNPSTEIPFRREFGAEFARAFQRFADSKDAMRAANAFIVARHLKTEKGVDFLADNLDPDTQQDASVRIAASSQLPKAVIDAPLSPPQLDALAKRVATIGRKEYDWVVASHEIDAITEMLRKEQLPAAQSDAIAMSLAGTINDLAARVLDGSQPQLVNALQRALLAVRNQLSNVAASSRGKLLNAITPTLDKLSAMKGKAPEALSGGDLADTFDAVVNTCGLLKKVRATGDK